MASEELLAEEENLKLKDFNSSNWKFSGMSFSKE